MAEVCQYTCMNKPKVTEYDYMDFLIGTRKVYSCPEAERVQPDETGGPSHDAFTRQPHRLFPTTGRLRSEAEEHADLSEGCLIADDGASDKLYSRKIEPVTRHRSGKHRKAVAGINLPTLLRTDGERYIPVAFRIYNRSAGGPTRNDHFRTMLRTAAERGFSPESVLFDSRYSGPENLKLIRLPGWRRTTRLKDNRPTNPDRSGNIAVSRAEISEHGSVVHLEGYGMIKVFRTVGTDGDAEYRVTSDLRMNDPERLKYSEISRMIETYHRGIRRFRGAERCRARSENAQRNHIETALRAFPRPEYHCFVKGISWFGAKTSIIRDAVRACLAEPVYTLEPISLYATA